MHHRLPLAPPPPEALPPPPSPMLLPASDSALPRAEASALAAAQEAHIARQCDPMWLAVLAWQYYYEDGAGTAGCLFCGSVVRAAPSTMVVHIAYDCRIADFLARRALRMCRVDPLAAIDVSDPYLGMLARHSHNLETTTEDQVETRGSEARSLPALPRPVNFDYAAAFEREAAEICALPESPVRLSDLGARYQREKQDLVDAGKRAEETIVAGLRELRSRRMKAIADARAVALESEDDKENVSPQAHSIADAMSTGMKRGLGGRRRRANKNKMLKLQESTKKRLFNDTLASVFSDEMSPPTSAPTAAPQTPPAPPTPPALTPTPATSDAPALVRDLALACITERVPVSFLSSIAFESALKRCCSALAAADIRQLATEAVETLAAPVDGTRDSMRVSPSNLTLCVNRASRLEPGRAIVYLVDERAQSVLIACQKDAREITSKSGRAVWLDEIRRYYLSVEEWCGGSLHLCVADYPAELRFELQALIGSSSELPLLVGGCMVQEFERLRDVSLRVLRDVPDVIRVCAELALLVNEVEGSSRSSQADASPLRLPVLSPGGNHLFGYAVLLKQVLCVKRELLARYQRAQAPGSMTEILGRAREILDSLQDQWTVVVDTLELLLPLATAELLRMCVGATTTPTMTLTSGVFCCLEMWLFASISRSPLLPSCEKARWRALFLQRQRKTRLDHQLAGLLLDPRLAGVGLSASGRLAAQALVVEICRRAYPSLDTQHLASQLLQFVNKSGAFADREIWEDGNTAVPMAFWRRMQSARELQEVALLVCSCAPASPSTSDSAMPPSAEHDFDHATRAAQIRHQLRAQARLRMPEHIASKDAMALLEFLTSTEGSSDVELNPTALTLDPFSWTPSGGEGARTTKQAIHAASEAYASTLTQIVEDATRKSSDSGAAGAKTPSRHPSSGSQLLRNLSASWIDCSNASLRAMHRAVGRVRAPPLVQEEAK